MPLGLFHSKKDRMLKEKSKSTFDLLNNNSSSSNDRFEESTKKALKKKSGSTLNLFATKASNSPEVFGINSTNPPDVKNERFEESTTKALKKKSGSTLNLFTTKTSNSSDVFAIKATNPPDLNSERFEESNKKVLKKKSGSTLNLFATKASNSPDVFDIKTANPPDVINALTKEHKAKSRSVFHLGNIVKTKSKSNLNLADRNNNNNSSHKEKVRSSAPVGPFRKFSSSSSNSEDGGSTKRKNKMEDSKDSPPRLRSTKKFTQGGSTDNMEGSREKRVSDLVQLDNYIEYLKKSEDYSIVNISNRLCCAQVLRLVLLKQQQMHANEALHSRPFNKNTNMNHRKNLNDCGTPSLPTNRNCLPINHSTPLRQISAADRIAPMVNKNEVPSEQTLPTSSPETQRIEHRFIRKGSNRQFKRSLPQISSQLSSEGHRSFARGNSNNSDSSFQEDDEGVRNDNLCKTWASTSTLSLSTSTSDLGPSLESLQTDDDLVSSQKDKNCGQRLSLKVFSRDVEIY
ncbi:hypothetical protein Btru_038000 [Bulinus truncatus]|nr:hypothetical protein Btru_038000 [Bulinus truncatus]